MAPSHLLFILLFLIFLQALALLWWCQLPVYLSLPAVLLVLIDMVVECRRLRAMSGVLSTRERRWFWRRGNGPEREFTLCRELVLWRWLIVINGRDLRGQSLRLVFARDSVHGDDWRRLQVALRFSRSTG